MTTFDCANPLNIASTAYVDCVATTISGALQAQIDECCSGGSEFSDFENRRSMYFHGPEEQWLQRSAVSSDDLGAGINLTLNLWAKIEDSPGVWANVFQYQAGSSAGDRVRFVISEAFSTESREIYYDAGNGTSHNTVDNIWEYGQWYMFSVDVNNTQYKLYLNGVEQTLEFGDDAYDLSSSLVANLTLGYGETYMSGFMRHVSIHEGSLNSTQLQAIYNGGTAIDLRQNQGSYAAAGDLLHYWFLGDDDDLGPEGVRDRVGNLHLTASGRPLIVLDTPHRF